MRGFLLPYLETRILKNQKTHCKQFQRVLSLRVHICRIYFPLVPLLDKLFWFKSDSDYMCPNYWQAPSPKPKVNSQSMKEAFNKKTHRVKVTQYDPFYLLKTGGQQESTWDLQTWQELAGVCVVLLDNYKIFVTPFLTWLIMGDILVNHSPR